MQFLLAHINLETTSLKNHVTTKLGQKKPKDIKTSEKHLKTVN